MKFKFLRKTGILLLAITTIHFSCYFPAASASSSMSTVTSEYYTCCEHAAGVCHDVGDISFLNCAAFAIACNNFIGLSNTDFRTFFKPVKPYNPGSIYNFQLDNIKTVQIII
jgi:hypothetical protein